MRDRSRWLTHSLSTHWMSRPLTTDSRDLLAAIIILMRRKRKKTSSKSILITVNPHHSQLRPMRSSGTVQGEVASTDLMSKISHLNTECPPAMRRSSISQQLWLPRYRQRMRFLTINLNMFLLLGLSGSLRHLLSLIESRGFYSLMIERTIGDPERMNSKGSLLLTGSMIISDLIQVHITKN